MRTGLFSIFHNEELTVMVSYLLAQHERLSRVDGEEDMAYPQLFVTMLTMKLTRRRAWKFSTIVAAVYYPLLRKAGTK